MFIYVCGVANGNCMVKMFNFQILDSLVALRAGFGLQYNSDKPFMHLFYLTLHHVNLKE